MKVMKTQVPNTPARKLYKRSANKNKALHVQNVPAHRGKKARSVVDDTFAALSIRKHAKIELLIDQAKYGD